VVLDGSNTSGFQRTMLIALGTDDSITETSNGPVRLATLCLEEESAYIEKSEAREAFYRLDRLGIPLVEVATEPDIHSPEQALEVAEEVGLMLRLTGDVQRGIGTIRQDLNVSVEGGSRQEIKGVQELELLGDIVRLEAQRQLNLLEIRNELGKRKAKTTGFNRIDVTTAFSETNSSLAKSAISKGHRIMCLSVPGFEGLLGRALQPNRRLGTELADYARVWAGLGGIIHSDELPAYGISETEVSEIRKLCCEAKPTAFILVLGEEHRARRALTAIHDRLETALKGVPSETRKVNEDGTTSYQRPLPGSARMYPETDLPPIAIK
ncbi:Glu-tRNA(Gln) amidotransferase subunit GatE, partial [bacterium]